MSSVGDKHFVRPVLVRVPLASAAAALACGIVAGRYAPFSTGFWAVLGGASLLAAGLTFLRRHLHLLTGACLAVAIVSIGAVHARLAYFSVPADHISTYVADSRHLATVRGRIVSAPQTYDDAPSSGWRRPPRTSFILQAEGIFLQDRQGRQGVSGLARATVQQPDDRLAPGQEVELVGWIGRVRGPDNPGQYDWLAAARSSLTLVEVTVPGTDGVTVLNASGGGWLNRMIWRLRAGARQHLMDCGDAESGRLIHALIVGERHPALRELNRAMVRGGIAHFLSISGLHLGVFLGFAYLLCRLVSLTPRRAALAVLAVLAAYVLLAEPRAPLLRSALMAAALCLATIARRRYAALNALGAAAVLLLAGDPMQLFTAGFQLSFITVAGILLLQEPIRRLLFGRWIRRRGLTVFRGRSAFRRWLNHAAADWMMAAVSMGLAAYVAAAPLVAVHFGLFSPYAAPLSLLVFPAVLAVLVPGYVSIALAWPMPNLSHAVGELSVQAARGLSGMVRAAEALPALSLELRPVGPLWALLCYGAVVLLLVHRRLKWGRAWAAAGVLAVAGATLATQRTAPTPAVAELHLLDVGDGQCAVLRTPSGRTFLLDAGTRGGFDACEQVLQPFLSARRLPAPSAAFVSHANTDHYNALPALLDRGGLDRAYFNDDFGASPGAPAAETDLLDRLAGRGVQVVRLRAGDAVDLDDRTRVEVLWPPAGPDRDRKLSPNDTSLVLRVRCDDRSVLLPGDAEEGVQARLSGSADLRADVLVLPHHGGWNGRLPDFADAVAPLHVLTSSSRLPIPPASAGEAGRQFSRRFLSNGRCLSTRANGWICVRFGRGKVTAETMR